LHVTDGSRKFFGLSPPSIHSSSQDYWPELGDHNMWQRLSVVTAMSYHFE
jgi:hypothetical protein